jgi:hypothetical protein
VLAAVAGLMVGLALHFLAVYLRDYGPAFDSISFRGNGALIVLPLAVVILIIGEVAFALRRAWPALAVWPVALFAGMFVVAGSF